MLRALRCAMRERSCRIERRPTLACRLVIFLVCLFGASAGHGAPLAIADALASERVGAVSLAPDGAHLAMLAYSNEKNGGAVLLLDATTLEAKPLYGGKSIFNVPLAIRWVGPQIIAVQTVSGIVTVSLDGTELRHLSGTMMRAIPGKQPGHERLFVDDSTYFKKVGARSADDETVSVDLPYATRSLVYDDDGIARVAISQRTAAWSDDTAVTYWYRAGESEGWRELAELHYPNISWRPIAVAKDGRSLIVTSREGRDTYALFRYDIATHQMTDLLAGHPREDIANFEVGDDESFTWVKTNGLKPTIHWFELSGVALQRTVDAAIPDHVNTVVRRVGERALIFSYADVDAGAWYLLDLGQSSLRKIVSVNNRVKAGELRPTRTVSYRTEDGFDVPAYLTLPEGADHNLPTIVYVHGGPVIRDTWRFDPEVQLLASRGYAVLQPQFRGSAGFGKRFEEAGFNQWGRSMQDDLTAGTRWLIEQRIADPKRICIYGASYGGYAAMWAMVKTPTMFRCGVSYAGVSDLNEMFTNGSDINDDAVSRLFVRLRIGDPVAMKSAFDEVSPLKHAAEFQVPVLIAHGDRDRRVPESQSQLLVAALRANHKQVEWIELPDEAHSLAKEKNQVRFFNALFDFLDRNIGSGGVASQ
jgi:dipeptidyl aminopeptidase/acylaminoacyl peptidase